LATVSVTCAIAGAVAGKAAATSAAAHSVFKLLVLSNLIRVPPAIRAPMVSAFFGVPQTKKPRCDSEAFSFSGA
jgi:hypothetical protein